MDDTAEGGTYGFCAVGVPADAWLETFNAIKEWRRKIKAADGIFLRKELHATEFVAGRGRVADETVPKGRRCHLFREALDLLGSMDHLLLFSVLLHRQDWAFERLLNRINRTMVAKGSQALLISDEGKETKYTKLARKMSVHNPIPSQFGVWAQSGNYSKNIPTERIIEDPVFRPSNRSYLLQMADFCAYALIRYEKGVPTHKEHYGIHSAFKLLDPICFKGANKNHKYGIIGK